MALGLSGRFPDTSAESEAAADTCSYASPPSLLSRCFVVEASRPECLTRGVVACALSPRTFSTWGSGRGC